MVPTLHQWTERCPFHEIHWMFPDDMRNGNRDCQTICVSICNRCGSIKLWEDRDRIKTTRSKKFTVKQ
ncbi:hypothetical protein L1987_64753 [Smallanthus sonchifolius]|uniref:Uncharacterized protein n=1 Tax=Smallanthus sonchifolius TaxID=185202 RepID=A0ACB9BSL0_9ASTR|nr:hypothetical protein L1987_64753 [Smallanthus sonchifolius]